MISACFTNYNRTDLLFQAIEPFLTDERIIEIVISDDRSTDDVYQTILWKYNGVEKVKIYQNETNLDCYRNKKRSVELATNEWVLVLDSDNIFSPDFIEAIFSQTPWNKYWAYAPEFARPHFDFRIQSGVAISKNNVSSCMHVSSFQTMLNAMNYFVNREEFLRVWGLSGSVDPVTSDSLFQNYNWLKGGNTIYVTPGLQYDHRVHNGSHYQNNVRRTARGFHESIIEKLKNMQ